MESPSEETFLSAEQAIESARQFVQTRHADAAKRKFSARWSEKRPGWVVSAKQPYVPGTWDRTTRILFVNPTSGSVRELLYR
jgi:hypothetical protein